MVCCRNVLSFTFKILLGYHLRFKLFADELVLLGNHRDAWVFGAADASSGTAALMELSRALGAQLKEGTVTMF